MVLFGLTLSAATSHAGLERMPQYSQCDTSVLEAYGKKSAFTQLIHSLHGKPLTGYDGPPVFIFGPRSREAQSGGIWYIVSPTTNTDGTCDVYMSVGTDQKVYEVHANLSERPVDADECTTRKQMIRRVNQSPRDTIATLRAACNEGVVFEGQALGHPFRIETQHVLLLESGPHGTWTLMSFKPSGSRTIFMFGRY